jgi:hypothetical protein
MYGGLDFLVLQLLRISPMDDQQVWLKLLEINKNIDDVGRKLGEHIVVSTEINKQIADHEKKLYGNGKQGIIITVDRLDQSHSRQTKLMWLIFTAVVPLVIGAVWSFFTKPMSESQNSNHTVVTQPASKTP